MSSSVVKRFELNRKRDLQLERPLGNSKSTTHYNFNYSSLSQARPTQCFQHSPSNISVCMRKGGIRQCVCVCRLLYSCSRINEVQVIGFQSCFLGFAKQCFIQFSEFPQFCLLEMTLQTFQKSAQKNLSMECCYSAQQLALQQNASYLQLQE